jgi:hypothetical protein
LLIFSLALWLTTPVHRINARGAEKLHSRMTLEEIEAILRVPPGDYRSDAAKRSPSHAMTQILNQLLLQQPGLRFAEDERELHPIPHRSEVWASNEGVVLVAFNRDGRASSITFASDDNPPLLDRIRDWLHLR